MYMEKVVNKLHSKLDFSHTFNATYTDIRYSFLYYYILLVQCMCTCTLEREGDVHITGCVCFSLPSQNDNRGRTP